MAPRVFDPAVAQRPARRLAIAVRGVVQGVGFRPFVYNAAQARGLTGWVQNEADTVRIEVQGDPVEVAGFCDALQHHHPPQARIDALQVVEVCCREGEPSGFEIRQSVVHGAPRPTIPADLATCSQCVEEVFTPGERRFGYPFTNCTNCGPRWSIIRRLPYDRPRTSMAGFAMCADCRAEYGAPADRRFHAQPIACPACGPALELLDRGGRRLAAGPDALSRTAQAILAGRIVAMKGLGGFQLLADATNAEAVGLLRARKRRPDKPFAVMLRSLDDARRRCAVSDEEARALTSPQAPILLVRRRAPCDVAAEVAPGNPWLGVMLPYTPLHHLLMAMVDRPIVCTSGNLSEEPMAISTEEAQERLGPIADVILTHNRPIVRPVDDSVARVGPDGLQVLRRARGFAPLPIGLAGQSSPQPDPLPKGEGTALLQPDLLPKGERSAVVLAVGGHLKNTVGLSLGSQAVLSPHVGDLDNLQSVEVHRQAIRDLVEFFGVTPDVVACDLHPDYASTRHAEQLAAGWGVPLVRVQHHHAHVAACMAEHGLPGPVLGFSWDGTGYGTDGTVWGGEVLLCQGAEFQRVAHLRTFPLPGGDRAVREPRRSALGVLFEILGAGASEAVSGLFTPSELGTLLPALCRGLHCPRTSSMGRLFDAVAALAGLPATISFEGQAAMALEFAADVEEPSAYPMAHGRGTPAVADWEPLIRALLADRANGVPVARISARFHNALIQWAVTVARQWEGREVVLTGGCFQNAHLSHGLRRELSQAGFRVYSHRQVPPGDGGIALGQLAVAAQREAGGGFQGGGQRGAVPWFPESRKVTVHGDCPNFRDEVRENGTVPLGGNEK